MTNNNKDVERYLDQVQLAQVRHLIRLKQKLDLLDKEILKICIATGDFELYQTIKKEDSELLSDLID